MGLIVGWYQSGGSEGAPNGAISGVKTDFSLTVSGVLHTADGAADVELFYADSFSIDENYPSVELRVNAFRKDGKTYVHSATHNVLATYAANGKLEGCQRVDGDDSFSIDSVQGGLVDLVDGAGTIQLSEDGSQSLVVSSIVEGGVVSEIPSLLGKSLPTGAECGAAGGDAEEEGDDRRLNEVRDIENMIDHEESHGRGLYAGGPSDREMWKMSVCSQYDGVFCVAFSGFRWDGSRRPESEGWGRVAHFKNHWASASATVFQKGSQAVLAFEETGLGACFGGNIFDCFTGLTDVMSDLNTGAVSCGAAGSTHGGACEYVKSLEGAVDTQGSGKTLQAYMASSNVKFITGWSLGGSAATVYSARNPGKYTVVTFGAFMTSGSGSCSVPGRRYWRYDDPAQSSFNHWTNPFPKFTHLSHDVQSAVKISEQAYCSAYANHWCLSCSGCGWGGCSGCHWYVCGHWCPVWNQKTRWVMGGSSCNDRDEGSAWSPFGIASGFDNLLWSHPNYDVVGFY